MDGRFDQWFRDFGDEELAAYRADFHSCRKIRIAEFLTAEKADRLIAQLTACADWVTTVSPPDNSFHFRYAFAAPGLTENGGGRGPFSDLARALRSKPFARRIQNITGFSEAFSIDVQATRYGPGDFIDEHNDDPPGYERKYAYVLNLSHNWRAEFGGLLLFPQQDQTVSGYVPSFNALVLFEVPMPHCVTPVAVHARAERYAVSGWIRLPA
jgi:SM-20-related protein